MKDDSSRPSNSEVDAFLTKLRTFRDSLTTSDQRLLNAMFFAAMGRPDKKDDEISAYWLAGVPYAGAIWATPWGGA